MLQVSRSLQISNLIQGLSSLPSRSSGALNASPSRKETVPESITKYKEANPFLSKGVSRENIKLDSETEKEIRGLKVIIAKLLAKELIRIYDKSKNQLENITNMIETFAPELSNDDDLKTFIVFYSLKTSLKNNSEHTEFLNRFPKGFLNYENEFFESRVRLIMKHLLIDIEGYDNAHQIENLRDFQPVMKSAGLDSIDHLLSRIDLLSITFPGYLTGEDPPIRPWLAYQPGKWHGESGKELAKKAVFWFLKYGENVIDTAGKYNLEKLINVIESGSYKKNEYGTMGMLRNCPFTPNIIDAIRLALPESIGSKPNQIHRWQVKYEGKWEDRDLINELTEYLVKYKLKCINSSGEISVEKITGNINWHNEFRAECSTALTKNKSGMISAYNALSHKYPELFGWRKKQIKPWEITQEGMWQGDDGIKLFQSAVAYTLWSNGLGTLDSEAYKPTFRFTKDDFINWYDRKIKENSSFIEDILNTAGLSGPYNTIAGKCHGGALRLLFGIGNLNITEQKLRVRSVILDLLKKSNNVCTVEFNPARKTIDKNKLVKEFFEDDFTFLPVNQPSFKRNPRDREALSSHDVTETRIKDFLEKDPSQKFLFKIKDILLDISDMERLPFCNLEQITAKTEAHEFIEFIEILRNTFVDDLNIKDDIKIKLKQLLENILYVEGRQKEFLSEIIKRARNSGPDINSNYLYTLENITEFLNQVIREYEVRSYVKIKKVKK